MLILLALFKFDKDLDGYNVQMDEMLFALQMNISESIEMCSPSRYP